MPYGSVNADVITTSTAGGVLGAGNASIMKNRIINGAMVIDQRAAGASSTITSNTFYSCDRWLALSSQSSKLTIGQNLGSVTPPVGFANYLGLNVLATATVGSSDYFGLRYNLEGFNTADLNFGSANAKTVTLSFWVYSNTTGTYGGSLQNYAGNRSYPFSYTISSANTWEQKSVTIAGDTSGTWVGASNAGSFTLNLMIGVGSTYSGTAGSWSANNYSSVTGATSVVGTNGATYYITGVQLEVGSSATGFEYRQYTTELQLCQRYFYKNICATGGQQSTPLAPMGWTYTTSRLYVPVIFPQPMRSTPTLSKAGGFGYNPFIGGVALTDMVIQDASNVSANIQANSSAGFTNNTAYWIGPNTVASDFIAFSAEL